MLDFHVCSWASQPGLGPEGDALARHFDALNEPAFSGALQVRGRGTHGPARMAQHAGRVQLRVSRLRACRCQAPCVLPRRLQAIEEQTAAAGGVRPPVISFSHSCPARSCCLRSACCERWLRQALERARLQAGAAAARLQARRGEGGARWAPAPAAYLPAPPPADCCHACPVFVLSVFPHPAGTTPTWPRPRAASGWSGASGGCAPTPTSLGTRELDAAARFAGPSLLAWLPPCAKLLHAE